MSRVLQVVLAVLCLSPALQAAPLQVFVSVLPQKTFVERIGGDRVAVTVMVLPGRSPHTYDPTPAQMQALAEADLYVRTGMPFEHAWMDRVRSLNPDMPILDNREGIVLRRLQAHHHGHGHDHHDELDAHVWTDPNLVIGMARGIRDQLSALMPEAASRFAANHDAFVDDLQALDREIRQTLGGVDNRRFLVFHPAWGYFADAYGFEQIAIESAGKEPGAQALAAVIDRARREGIRIVFVQPQFNRRAAERVADAIDGRVEPIDPLDPDYFANLRAVAEAIAAANRR